MIFQILAIPIVLILGTLFAVVLFLYAFSVHILLGLAGALVIALLFYALIQWERRRVERDMPQDDDYRR